MKIHQRPWKHAITEDVNVSLRGFHNAFTQRYDFRIIEHIPAESIVE